MPRQTQVTDVPSVEDVRNWARETYGPTPAEVQAEKDAETVEDAMGRICHTAVTLALWDHRAMMIDYKRGGEISCRCGLLTTDPSVFVTHQADSLNARLAEVATLAQ